MPSNKRKDFDTATINDASAADSGSDDPSSQGRGSDDEATNEAAKQAGKAEDDGDFPSRMKRSKGGHKDNLVLDVPQAVTTDNDDNLQGMEEPNRIVEKDNDALAFDEQDNDVLAQDLPQGPPPVIYNIESFQTLCATITDVLLTVDAPANDNDAHDTPETSTHQSDDALLADNDEAALYVAAANSANETDTANGGLNSDVPYKSAAERAADASPATDSASDTDPEQDPLETAVDGQSPVSKGESCSYELSGQGRAAAVRAEREAAADVMGGELTFTAEETRRMAFAVTPPGQPLEHEGFADMWLAEQLDRMAKYAAKFDLAAVYVHAAAVVLLRGPVSFTLASKYGLCDLNAVDAAAPHPPLHTATDKQLLQRFTFEARRQHEVGEAFTHEVTLTQDALQLLESVLPLDGFPEWLPNRLGRVRARLALLQHLDVWMNWELPPIDAESWPASQQTTMLRDFVDLPPSVFWAQVHAATSGSRIGTTDDDNDDDDSKATAQDLDAKFSGLQADAVTA